MENLVEEAISELEAKIQANIDDVACSLTRRETKKCSGRNLSLTNYNKISCQIIHCYYIKQFKLDSWNNSEIIRYEVIKKVRKKNKEVIEVDILLTYIYFLPKILIIFLHLVYD